MNKNNSYLSNRMLALISLLTKGRSVADIGCDHAYVSIYLIEQGISPKAIAMDIGEGPLMRAKENIAQHGLTDVIETRLSDGARELKAGEVSAAIIAGMGGMLMKKILADSIEVFKAMDELVLQPQSDLSHFRSFLYDNGFEITDEDMIYEEGKFYPMMKVQHVGLHKIEKPSMAELTYGPFLLKKKHPVLKDYLEFEAKKLNEIENSLKGKEMTESVSERITLLKQEFELNNKARGICL